VNERHRGRAAASSTVPAIHWRTATTPAGPITPNASAPVAAPNWLESAPPNIIAGPVHGRAAAGPVLAGPVLAGPVLAGPVLAGPVLAGPVLAGTVLAGTVLEADRAGTVVVIPPGCTAPALA